MENIITATKKHEFTGYSRKINGNQDQAPQGQIIQEPINPSLQNDIDHLEKSFGTAFSSDKKPLTLGPDHDKWEKTVALLQQPKTISKSDQDRPVSPDSALISDQKITNSPIKNYSREQLTAQNLNNHYPHNLSSEQIKLPYFAPLEHLINNLSLLSTFDSITGDQIIKTNLNYLLVELELAYDTKSKLPTKILDDLSKLGYSYSFSIVLKELMVSLLSEQEHTEHLTMIRKFLDIQKQSKHQLLRSFAPSFVRR